MVSNKSAQIDANNERWEELYLAAFNRYEVYGDCNAPYNSRWPEGDPGGVNLGTWINTQKNFKLKGLLSNHRVNRLERIGIVWRVTNEDRWNASFELLCSWKDKYGDFNIPHEARWPENDSTGYLIGRWTRKQARLFESLSPNQRHKLKMIGFDPQYIQSERQKIYDSAWDRGYQCAKERYFKYGTCNAPGVSRWPEHDPNGFKLANWIKGNRQLKKKGFLSQERIDRLDQLGINWGYGC